MTTRAEIERVQLPRWTLWVSAAFALLAPPAVLVSYLAADSPDEKTGCLNAMLFVFLPISFIVALVSAVSAGIHWHSLTHGQKTRALLPLCFPVLSFLLGAGLYALLDTFHQ
jgi:hypothetical protein